MEQNKWIIWSIEHNGWWGPNHTGYVTERKRAGRYDYRKALEIVESANYGLHDTPNEAMIELTQEEI